MIIVKNPPAPLVGVLASPVVYVKVLGRNGFTLRYYTVNLLTKQIIDKQYSQQITSDPYETTVVFPTPSGDSLLLYVIEVVDASGNVLETTSFTAPFLPTGSNISLGEVYDSIVLITKTGQVFDLGKGSVLPVHTLLISIAKKQGKLIMYEGTNNKLEVEGKQAIIKLTFRITDDLAHLTANYIDDANVSAVVYKEPSLAPRLGILAYITQMLKSSRLSIVGVDVSRPSGANYYDVNVYVSIDLYSSWDWRSFINVLLGIGAIVGGVLTLIGTLMLSAPLSLAMIGAGLSLLSGAGIVVFNTLLREEPSGTVSQAETITKTSLANIDQYVGDLTNYLNTLLAQGKITQDEYNTIMNYINKIVSTAKTAITELNDLVGKAYNEGYSKGVSDQMKWIAIAGIGGFVGGYLLSPRIERVIERVRGA